MEGPLALIVGGAYDIDVATEVTVIRGGSIRHLGHRTKNAKEVIRPLGMIVFAKSSTSAQPVASAPRSGLGSKPTALPGKRRRAVRPGR